MEGVDPSYITAQHLHEELFDLNGSTLLSSSLPVELFAPEVLGEFLGFGVKTRLLFLS